MQIRTFASGSSGNCTLFKSGEEAVLVDAGISAKRIAEGLDLSGVKPGNLSGILITHEHVDHISGLKVFLKHYPVPVYTAHGTARAFLHSAGPGDFASLFHEVKAGESFSVGSFSVDSFSVSHDAADPLSYKIHDGERTAALMTDLGVFTEAHSAFLKDVDALILEANHDIRMLETGPYPYALKRRILSDFGHLSNENAGKLLLSVLHPGLKLCLLAHLSEENNLPELALLSVRNEIDLSGSGFRSSEYKIETAPRSTPSPMYDI